MADDPQDASPKAEPAIADVNEDAETRAARRELKQSSISDSTPNAAGTVSDDDDTSTRPITPTSTSTSKAPELSASDLKEQVASPKKKRAHDQLDGDQAAEDNDANSVASTDSAKDRASRLEPEKKRHRDEDPGNAKETSAPAQEQKGDAEEAKLASKSDDEQPSTSAFAASGFGKLTSTASPFAALGGASAKGSAFGSSTTPSLSSFASPTAPPANPSTTAPKLTFGSTTGASPFAGLSSGANGFGSGLGGGTFGSSLSSIKPLSSFAAPGGGSLKSEKPARPFGAPDSDAEDDDDDDDDDENDAEPEAADRAASPEKEVDEKKKLKLQKVEVNSGEEGEETVVSVRAKMYCLDGENWKERGVGMLKINVPQVCVEYDDSGNVIAGSFDASALHADDDDGEAKKGHKVSRLLMRQDQTGKVILNTALVGATKFTEKSSLKHSQVLFTALEGQPPKATLIAMRMSAANVKSFMNEIGIIQRELQSS